MSTAPNVQMMPQKAAGHSADVQQPITGILHHVAMDPGVVRNGAWTSVSDVRAMEGSYFQSSTTNDTVTLNYVGTSVWIRFRIDSSSGQAEVSIDGTIRAAALDLYSSTGGYVMPVFGLELPRQQHKLQIRVTGNKNAASTAATIKVNAFVTDLQSGLIQTLSMSEETIPTLIGGVLPFLLTVSATAFYLHQLLRWGLL